LDSIDNIWTLISLLVFAFALGARTAWDVLGGKKRFIENDKRDAAQQKQINELWQKMHEMLNQKGVKKVTVKRRQK